MPVSALVAVTVALATTAPLESVMVPEMLPPTPAEAVLEKIMSKASERWQARRRSLRKESSEEQISGCCGLIKFLALPMEYRWRLKDSTLASPVVSELQLKSTQRAPGVSSRTRVI